MDPESLVAHLLAGGDADPALARSWPWAVACQILLERNELALAARILPRLADAFPKVPYLATMNRMMPLIPEASADRPPFTDDIEASVQIAPYPGSDTVLFCFTGAGGKLGFDLNLIHRWISWVPAHIVYLRGYWPVEVQRDQPYAGSDPATALTTLKDIVRKLDARRILCWGNSIGGYGALRFGQELGAEAVLAFGAKTTLEDGLTSGAPNYRGPDLRPLYADPQAPRACLVYAERHPFDSAQARNLAGLPTVTFCPVADSDGHNVIAEIIASGSLQFYIDWLMVPQPMAAIA